jgi:hypothetical protein
LGQLLDKFDPMFMAERLGHLSKRCTHAAGGIAT